MIPFSSKIKIVIFMHDVNMLTYEYTYVKIRVGGEKMRYSIDEAVEKFVPLKTQRMVLAIGSLGWGTVAAGVMVMGFTIPSISKFYALSVYQVSWFASMTFMGMLIGAFLSGYISDFIGRSKVAFIALILASLFNFFTAFKMNYSMLLTIRFLAGVGLGGLLPAVNTIVTEFSSVKRRGKYLVLLESSWAWGSIAIGTIAVIVKNWKVDYLSFSVGLIFALLFLIIPETPRYLIQKGKVSALKERAKKIGISIPSDTDFEVNVMPKEPLSSLFRRGYTSTTLMVWFLWFSLSFSYYGFFIWLPKMVGKMAGTSLTSSLFFLFVMMIAQLPGYYTGAYLVEKIGRKKTLFYSLIGTAFFSILFAFGRNDASLLTFGIFMTFFCMSAWGSTYAYTPELYPTAFRGSANGSSGAMARIAGIIAPLYTSFMIEKNSVQLAIITFGSFLVTSAVWIILAGKETRNSKID